MTTDVKLLPFDTYMSRWDAESQQMARQYARANMEPLLAENERLAEALRWYAEQTALCRKLGSAGDAGRSALDADGGKRARAALDQEGGNG